MTGRKPVPANLRVLRGNPDHRPIPDDSMIGTYGVGEPPEHLDETARKEWRRISKDLESVLKSSDASALEIYCRAYSAWRQATAAIDRSGFVIRVRGIPQTNPYNQIMREAVATMQKFMAEFGLTPSARARVAPMAKPARGKTDKSRFFA